MRKAIWSPDRGTKLLVAFVDVRLWMIALRPLAVRVTDLKPDPLSINVR